MTLKSKRFPTESTNPTEIAVQTQASEEVEFEEADDREAVIRSQELVPLRDEPADLQTVNQKVIVNLEMTIVSYKRSILELENRLQEA